MGAVGLFAGRKPDHEILEELEGRLLLADVGVDVTNHLMKNWTGGSLRQQLHDVPALLQALREELLDISIPCQQPWQTQRIPALCHSHGRGQRVGKTTTIGKLAKKLQDDGHPVLLAAE